MVGHPLQGAAQQVLAYGDSGHEVFAQAVGGAGGLGKVAFRVGDEGPGVDRVADFLLVEGLSRYVDGAEPLQLFGGLAAADVDGEGVAEDALLHVGGLVEEVLEFVGELPGHVLADGERALLPVHHFVGAFSIVAAAHPVHHAHRVAVQHGADDGLLLPFVVNELALVGRADVQFSAVAAHALLFAVGIAVEDFADGHFALLDCHHGAKVFI